MENREYSVVRAVLRKYLWAILVLCVGGLALGLLYIFRDRNRTGRLPSVASTPFSNVMELTVRQERHRWQSARSELVIYAELYNRGTAPCSIHRDYLGVFLLVKPKEGVDGREMIYERGSYEWTPLFLAPNDYAGVKFVDHEVLAGVGQWHVRYDFPCFGTAKIETPEVIYSNSGTDVPLHALLVEKWLGRSRNKGVSSYAPTNGERYLTAYAEPNPVRPGEPLVISVELRTMDDEPTCYDMSAVKGHLQSPVDSTRDNKLNAAVLDVRLERPRLPFITDSYWLVLQTRIGLDYPVTSPVTPDDIWLTSKYYYGREYPLTIDKAGRYVCTFTYEPDGTDGKAQVKPATVVIECR